MYKAHVNVEIGQENFVKGFPFSVGNLPLFDINVTTDIYFS